MAVQAGVAYVPIFPQLAGFASRLKAGVAAGFAPAEAEAAAHGAKMGHLFAEGFKAFGLTAAAFGGFELVKEGIEASDQLTESTDRLKVAAENSHLAWERVAPAMAQVRAEGQKLGFGVAAVTDAYGTLLTRTGNVATAEHQLATAENLARFRHIDLAAAVDLTTRLYQGNARTLKILGVEVSSTATAQEKAAAILTAVNKINHQADAYTESLAGRWAVLKTQIIGTSASIAHVATPAISGLLRVITTIGPATTLLVAGQVLFGRKIASAFETAGASSGRFATTMAVVARSQLEVTATSERLAIAEREVALSTAGATEAQAANIVALRASLVASQSLAATGGLAGSMGRIRASMITASAEGVRFGRTIEAIKGSANIAKGGLSNVVGFLGGPWMIGITAGIGVLAAFMAVQDKIKAKAQATTTALGEYAEALKEGVTPSSIDAAQAILKQDAGLRGIVDLTHSLGLEQKDVVAGLNGESDARNKVVGAIKAHISALQAELDASYSGAHRFKDLQEQQQFDLSHQYQIDQAQALVNAYEKQFALASEVGTQTGYLADETQKAADATTNLTQAQESLADKFALVLSRGTDAADKMSAIKSIEDSLYGAAIQDADALENFAAALRGLTTELANNYTTTEKHRKVLDKVTTENINGVVKVTKTYKDHVDQIKHYNHSMDINTEAGQKNTDAVKDAISAAKDRYNADIANNVPIAKANADYEKRVKLIKDEARHHGLNQKAIQGVIDTYGQVPTGVKSLKLVIPGIGDLVGALKEAYVLWFAITHNETLEQAQKQINSAYAKSQSHDALTDAAYGRATGGPITGRGSKTSDSNLVRLSTGEYVEPAAAVDYYGAGLFEALRNKVPLTSLVSGQAAAPAAPTHNYGGVTVNVHNPVPEQASESVPAAMRRLAYQMGG